MIAEWKKKRDEHTSLSFPEACSGFFSAKNQISNFQCELRNDENGKLMADADLGRVLTFHRMQLSFPMREFG